jgi:hypothetical protein
LRSPDLGLGRERRNDQALKRYFPHAAHQRCTVHYLRNALAHVSSTTWKQEVRDGLRDIWAAPTRQSLAQLIGSKPEVQLDKGYVSLLECEGRPVNAWQLSQQNTRATAISRAHADQHRRSRFQFQGS